METILEGLKRTRQRHRKVSVLEDTSADWCILTFEWQEAKAEGIELIQHEQHVNFRPFLPYKTNKNQGKGRKEGKPADKKAKIKRKVAKLIQIRKKLGTNKTAKNKKGYFIMIKRINYPTKHIDF